ncbi:hypothetical protein ABE41_008185 [Fictibacillus arsenicus]|uniref:GGDEF domain-containing protein n=1 Tax=Fictibacillus arsenicus TaxID=255247 RepID=A0A1B1Z3C8_9BACL|nr:hypothetical protein ABE41_008185 [Fictibacillus arsenicus]
MPAKEGKAYRYGGEEFAWIMETAVESEVTETIQQINTHLQMYPYTLEDGKLPVTLNYGIAFYQKGERPAEIIQRADTLLYGAKAAGGNTLKFDHKKNEEKQLIM